MGKNKPIIGFILGIIVAVVIFFANIPGLERTGQMCTAFSLMTVIFWAFGIAQSRLCLRSVSFAFSSFLKLRQQH